MLHVRYYLSLFLRRLPWFLLVAGVISGFAISVAITRPAAYVSSTRLLVESSQIPGNLATSTVNTSGEERLQIIETRLLTREVLLDIARSLNAVPNIDKKSPDGIVAEMRRRTKFRTRSRANRATLLTITFVSPDARVAAAVLNEYLTRLLELDTDYRTGQASQTQEFFQQEVTRLSEELDKQSALILDFKARNADALPDAQSFRRSRQAALQERLADVSREISTLEKQAARLEEVFAATGQVPGAGKAGRSPDEIALAKAERDLREAMIVYSETNPKVKLLRSRIAQLREAVATGYPIGQEPEEVEELDPAQAMYNLQQTEISTRLRNLEGQRTTIEAGIAELDDAIARTAGNSIALDALERDYRNIQNQYNQATTRLATASTGERIELLSKGQRISVVEQPTVPGSPSRPNRKKIAMTGIGAGVLAGLALIGLLELLNTTARRPADLINRLGITPLVTVPYLRTRREIFRRRAGLVAAVLVIAMAIPAGIYALHTYYQPLDLLADQIMNRLGVRG